MEILPKFLFKKTVIIFGEKFTFSIIRISWVDWVKQLKHMVIHLAVALWNPYFSAGGAVFSEMKDAEQGHLQPWKEGFNIFPDFLFRVAGVVAGYFGHLILIALLFIWSIS